MTRIPPSLVVTAIGDVYPWADPVRSGQSPGAHGLGPDQAPIVAMIARLIDQIPSELRPTDPHDRLKLEAARGMMDGALENWSGAPHSGLASRLQPSAVTGGEHPIVAVVRVLRKCPDDYVPTTTPQLAFVSDPDARDDLRRDIASAFRNYDAGDFKAATVLAGAVLEAILLNRIEALGATAMAIATASVAAKRGAKSLRPSIDDWDLVDLIDVALELAVLDGDSHKAVHAARSFRNLIHPGRSRRLGDRASRGTALSAIGAMQRVLERLDPTA